mgnify:CR=1 FL=1
MATPPYFIVLLGDVGVGKSAIFEKLTGLTGRSGHAVNSTTLTSEIVKSWDRRLIVADTPGANPMRDKLEYNLHIAQSMNNRPVACVLIVVRADIRMDNVIRNVSEYAERFYPNFPSNLFDVCVTHMDTVTWTERDFLLYVKEKLGIETVVFSSLNTTGEALSQNLLNLCARKRPANVNIDAEMFLRVFKISNSNLKILRETRKEAGRFKQMKDDFFEQRQKCVWWDRMNMTFQFNKWILAEIIAAQHRFITRNSFTFDMGPDMGNDVGNVANLTNELRPVLTDLRIEAYKAHKDVDCDIRQCPHCGEIWQKVEGSDGDTVCGQRPSNPSDHWSGELVIFQFTWDSASEKLSIKKVGVESKITAHSTDNVRYQRAGCGKTIKWSNMNKFISPFEHENPDIGSTSDLFSLPDRYRRDWETFYDRVLRDPSSVKHTIR